MTTPLWCLMIAVLIPYVLAPIGAYLKKQELGSVDLNEPRTQSAQVTGAGARAVAAQDNMWEGVAVFSAAVLVNHVKGDADPTLSATLAQVFIAARIVHPIAYIANIAPLRSVAFLVGFVCCIWLFLA
jgi:uncharacterized MAPEG superfamily protein